MPAEDAPQMVETEEGNKIPVRVEGEYPTYTDEKGTQLATGHDISPGTEEQWGLGKDVEHDPSRAHDMATTGDTERTVEANQRLAMKAMDTFSERYNAEAPGTFRETKAAIEKAGHSEPYHVMEALRAEAHGKGDWLEERFIKEEKDSLQRRESAANERAVKLEKWAGILHDHPISSEFQARFPDTVFTPEELVALEDSAEGKKKTVEQAGKKLAEMTGAEALGAPRFRDWEDGRTYSWDVYHMAQQLGEEQDQALEEWKRLCSDGSTTLDQLKEFYSSLLHKIYLDPTRNEANLISSVLEDIHSGRASQPPEPNNSEQVAA